MKKKKVYPFMKKTLNAKKEGKHWKDRKQGVEDGDATPTSKI